MMEEYTLLVGRNIPVLIFLFSHAVQALGYQPVLTFKFKASNLVKLFLRTPGATIKLHDP